MQSSDLQPTLRNVTFSALFSLHIVTSHSSAKIVLQLPSSAFVFQQVCSLNSKCRSADFLFDQLFLRYLFSDAFHCYALLSPGRYFVSCFSNPCLFPKRHTSIPKCGRTTRKSLNWLPQSNTSSPHWNISPAYCFTAKQVQAVFFSLEYEQALERDVGGNCTETLQLWLTPFFKFPLHFASQ